MKIQLIINFDSVTEYEAFRQNTSIEEVRAKAKGAEVKANIPEVKKDLTPARETPEDSAKKILDKVKNNAHSTSDIKILLSEKMKEGKKEEVKAFFESHGVKNFTALTEKADLDIDAVYAEAETI